MEVNALKIDFEACLNLPYRSGRLNFFPTIPAVYIIYTPPDTALYIGATVSLKRRSREHLPTYGKIPDVRIAWFPLPVHLHESTESGLIKALCPSFNQTYQLKEYRNRIITGRELRKRRDRLGISQSKLGTALGVSGNTIARWERDEMGIPAFLGLALQTIEREYNHKIKGDVRK